MNNDLLVSISPETPSWGLLRVPKTWTLGAPGSEQMLVFHFFLVVSGVIVKGMLPSTFFGWWRHLAQTFKSDFWEKWQAAYSKSICPVRIFLFPGKVIVEYCKVGGLPTWFLQMMPSRNFCRQYQLPWSQLLGTRCTLLWLDSPTDWHWKMGLVSSLRFHLPPFSPSPECCHLTH